jgi:hypothetical protein
VTANPGYQAELLTPSESNDIRCLLEQPITSDDLLTAWPPGARHKVPTIDGLSLEFYTANWETIRTRFLQLLNHLFLHKYNPPRQKQGIVVFLPKSTSPRTPDEYRPISLLTTEYKLIARILARSHWHVIALQLQNSQFSGVPGNSILDSISCVRDAVAQAKTTGTPLCILILVFQQAFDRISHQYLFQII